MPEEVVEHYSLKKRAKKDGYIRMYKLPQSGFLAKELVEKSVGKCGYYRSEYTPGLWLHKTRSIAFSLCLHGFGVKCVK